MLSSIFEPGLKRPVLLFVCIAAAFLSWNIVAKSGTDPRVNEVCQLVYNKHYLGNEILSPWLQRCRNIYIESNQDSEVLEKLTDILAELPGSHLKIFTPEEDTEAWQGVAGHTGIFARSVNGRFFIYKVSPESNVYSKVKVGDEILHVSGMRALSHEVIERVPGKYILLRNDEEITVDVSLNSIQLDRKPQLEKKSEKIARLEISSFRHEYFGKNEWRNILSNANAYQKLILDLRGNRGGDFRALGRALSGFMCDAKPLGVLNSPRSQNENVVTLPDDDENDPLIPWIGSVRSIQLTRFNDYPCYHGELRVLIDRGTASVSEIFAGLLKSRPKTKILGQASSGEVLVGVWYDLKSFSRPHALSIPEATFIGRDGHSIEGEGVMPDHFLFYEVIDLSRGIDSWLEQAKKI